MTVFVPMDKLIGPDFERGLANLKTAAEHPQRMTPPFQHIGGMAGEASINS